MSNSYFKFKRFTIHHDKCAMKVGTDGVLLGAWANISHCKNILDIGCGSGLISIMAAQRSNATITGVDIDPDASIQAAENARESQWSQRINIIQSDIITYKANEKFDAMLCNPPFFSNSLKCPTEQRSIARHDASLLCSDLMQFASLNLTDEGTLSVVIPYDLLQKWCDEALFKGLSTSRITAVKTLPHKPSKRALVEFSKKVCHKHLEETLILEETPGRYSNEAKNLLRDFYTKIED